MHFGLGLQADSSTAKMVAENVNRALAELQGMAFGHQKWLWSTLANAARLQHLHYCRTRRLL
jgi:hypothetical protein